tara:strand:+ start:89 stop:280 length:192 start_codon:yes stop_codon:yes gene_type:complete
MKVTPTVTYDDTRDIAIKIIEKLMSIGILEDKEAYYLVIQDEINEVLGLDIDDNFEVGVIKLN